MKKYVIVVGLTLMGLLSGCIGSAESVLKYNHDNDSLTFYPNDRGEFLNGKVDVNQTTNSFIGDYLKEDNAYIVTNGWAREKVTILNDTALQDKDGALWFKQ